MKWAVGILGAFIFFYFIAPFLFGAMAQHDYETLYQGMQGAKRSAGAFVQDDRKEFKSYSERFARGEKLPD